MFCLVAMVMLLVCLVYMEMIRVNSLLARCRDQSVYHILMCVCQRMSHLLLAVLNITVVRDWEYGNEAIGIGLSLVEIN